MADLTIRTATLADAARLYEWDEKPHVQAAVSNSGTTSFEADWEEELAVRADGTEFFIADLTTDKIIRSIGAMQVIDPATEQTHYWGPVASNQRAIDIWIGEVDCLGKGYGTQMMTYVIDHCFAQAEVVAILIDPLSNNIRSHKFYKTLGFELAGHRRFDEESDCSVFWLPRSTWESM